MHENIGTLILAVYPERGLAEEDFEMLQDRPLDRDFEIVDTAMVFKDDQGRVAISKRPRPSRRRGDGRACGGARAVHFRRGLSLRDLRELGDTLDQSSVAVIAVGRGPGAEKLAPVLHCTDLVINQTKPVDLAFRYLVARHGDLG